MIDILTVFSAFDIKTSENVKKFIEKNSLKDIPDKEIFGVFTTINRSQKLNSWPKDIHGCLGYWDDNHMSISKDKIIKKIEELSYNTNFQDNRRTYFPRDLSQDANAFIEISLMLLPLLNPETVLNNKEIFNNDKYGLIVESASGRATYLPEVFHSISWDKLKKSLLNKAGVSDGKFLAYKTHKIICPIYDTLFSQESQNLLEVDVARFFKEHYKTFIPYAFIDNHVVIDKAEDVRNLGTIGDVIRFSKLYSFDKDVIKENLEYYYKKFKENPEQHRQSSAFLLENYYMLNIHPERVKEISDFLYKNILVLEPRFELGEVLKVLAEVEPRKDILEMEAKKMYSRLEKMGLLDDVFELNWQIQFLEKSKISSREKNARKIWEVLRAILLANLDNLQTNFWAVIYECLSNLIKIIQEDEIKNRRQEYFIKLNSRKGEYGLYFFKGMNEARIDITGHVIFS